MRLWYQAKRTDEGSASGVDLKVYRSSRNGLEVATERLSAEDWSALRRSRPRLREAVRELAIDEATVRGRDADEATIERIGRARVCRGTVHSGLMPSVSLLTVAALLLLAIAAGFVVGCETGRSQGRSERHHAPPVRVNRYLEALRADDDAVAFFRGQVTPRVDVVERSFQVAQEWPRQRAEMAIVEAINWASADPNGKEPRSNAIKAARRVLQRFSPREVDSAIERAPMTEKARADVKERARRLLDG